MSEDGEMWRKIREDGQRKRWANHASSLSILEKKGLTIIELSASTAHYRVINPKNGEVRDFWPTTGKFYDHKRKRAGRGVFNLIKYLETP